ncbi:MAG: prefoldin subunit beta [Nanoarchaeota archaeon]|nr:prefoldin subunit beta [Nanoarchaeota archaeon]
MNLDKETQEKIQELQGYEQNLHGLLMQKQAFQMELSESENALSEISSSKDDVFKLVGSIMIKASKENVIKEINTRKDLLMLRLKSIEKQESELTKQMEELRDDVMKKIK